MKYIGYMRAFDSRFSLAKSLNYYRTGQKTDPQILKKILHYLKNGKIIWTWMEYWSDDEDKPIGGAVYRSDGEWVWPEYYTYYLEKYGDLSIDSEFISHIKNSTYVVKELSEEDLYKIEYQYQEDIKKYFD